MIQVQARNSMLKTQVYNPLISVVMSVYRLPIKWLAESVESILNQTFKDFEFVILLDDPDNAEVDHVLSKYSDSDSRIRYFKNDHNLGIANSLNKLLKLTRGKYIAQMNHDDIAFPHRLQAQLQFLNKNPEISLVGSDMVYIDDKGHPFEYVKSPVTPDECLRWLLTYRTPSYHSTWLFRRKISDTLGGYRLLPYTEDFDFLARALSKGFKISNISEPFLMFRRHRHNTSLEQNILINKTTAYIVSAFEKKSLESPDFWNEDVRTKIIRVNPLVYSLHANFNNIKIKILPIRSKYPIIYYFLFLTGSLISPHQLWFNWIILKRNIKYSLFNQGKN